MSQFTARVQLHKEHDNLETYTKLHSIMEAEGFLRTIKINTIQYRLPFGLYVIECDLPMISVVAKAHKAASLASSLEASIVVTKADGELGISGLKPLKKLTLKINAK